MRRFLPVVLFAAFVGVSIVGLAAQDGLEPTLTPPILLATTISSEEKEDIRETPVFETATLSPSLTATASLTPALMATGSPTTTPAFLLATPSFPQITVDAFNLQLFDSFEPAPLGIWNIADGWSLVPSETGSALQAATAAQPLTITYPNLTDISMSAHLRLDDSAVRLFARRSAEGDYGLLLDSVGNVTLTRSGVVVASAQTSTGGRSVRFAVVGQTLAVWIDDIPVLSYVDPSPLSGGVVGFDLPSPIVGTVTLDEVVFAWRSDDAAVATLAPFDSPSSQSLATITGQTIAYMNSGNFLSSSIPVLDANGNAILSLTGAFPAWSLDGRYLAYLTAAPQVNRYNFETTQAEPLGGNTSLILPRLNGTFWDPAWSPSSNANKIAFVESRESGRMDVFVMNTDRTGLLNLTATSPDPINFLPTWSPDGQWIAFASTDNTALAYKIRIIKADGTGPITTIPSANSYSLPFWAGSGNHLAFWNVTNPLIPTLSMVSFTTSSGSIGTVGTFNPAQSSDWGRVWVQGGGSYAYMTSFNGATGVFDLKYSTNNQLIGTGWFPKWRPIYQDWVITVTDPNALVPPISIEVSYTCPLKINNQRTEGLACALNVYRSRGATFTWAQLVSLILHGEGNSLLSDYGLADTSRCVNNTSPGFPVARTLEPNATPPATAIAIPRTFVSADCNPTVHNEFIYAIVEQMFNECRYINPDSKAPYGQCTEQGLSRWLGIIQRYREGNVSDSSTYLSRAQQEIQYFLEGSNGRVMGRCPCTTGNVNALEIADLSQINTLPDNHILLQGQLRAPGNEIFYTGYLPRSHWYPYSFYDNGPASTDGRYLKIY